MAALIVCLFLASGQSLSALQVRSGQEVVIEPGTTIDDDLLATGQDILVRGTVSGNLIAAAQTVTIEGKVLGSVFAFAQTVKCTAPVDGSFHAAGETVDLDSAVRRNAAMAGRRVTLGPASTVRRDALAAGESVDASGIIVGGIQAAGANVGLDGPVGGGARLWAQKVSLTDKARIVGDLFYVSPVAAQVAPDAKILGRVIHQLPKPPMRREHRRALLGLFWFLRLIWLLLFTALLTGLLPRHMYDASDRIRRTPLWALLTGFLVVIVMPIAALILILPMLPGALMLGTLWLSLLYIAQVVAAIFLGSWIFRLAAKREIVRPVLAGVVGVVIILLLELIPGFRHIGRIVVVLFGVGGLGLTIGRGIAAAHEQRTTAPPTAPIAPPPPSVTPVPSAAAPQAPPAMPPQPPAPPDTAA
jgi:hypothetical protein